MPVNTKAYYFPNATSKKNFTDSTELDIFGDVYYAVGEGEEASEYWNPDDKIYLKKGDIIDTSLIPNVKLEINDANRDNWLKYRPVGQWAAYGPELALEVNIPVLAKEEIFKR